MKDIASALIICVLFIATVVLVLTNHTIWAGIFMSVAVFCVPYTRQNKSS